MRSLSSGFGTTAQILSDTGPGNYNLPASSLAGHTTGDRVQAIQGPIQETASAAKNPAHAMPDDLSAEASGRRTLSTAFVGVGPDGHLTIELHDGRMLVLRDVAMHPRDYCGAQVQGGLHGKRHCGKYADIAAAKPGGAPIPDESVPAVSNPVAHF